MKLVRKGLIPEALQNYMDSNPEATWDEMSGDNTLGGGKLLTNAVIRLFTIKRGFAHTANKKYPPMTRSTAE
ncbi:MAG: hypothetical protein FWH57_11120 [Oscillospiraceae bacterium]|nr:hypothetical protein [Oscillospiraceae bacterium]